jgi:hypothetical protein
MHLAASVLLPDAKLPKDSPQNIAVYFYGTCDVAQVAQRFAHIFGQQIGG